jgi:hypothetical protein
MPKFIGVFQYPDFQGPPLPGKTVLKNMNKDFLEKRKGSLNVYLQVLCSHQSLFQIKEKVYFIITYNLMKFVETWIYGRKVLTFTYAYRFETK